MYTGIVQGLCPVRAVHERDNLRSFEVELAELAAGAELGASIALNGTCLTVTAVGDDGCVSFDVIPQTLRNSNLALVKAGDLVNVERSARIGDELGGHKVSGHVTGTVTVADIRIDRRDHVIAFDVPAQWLRYLFPKGFVALDGASLTISHLDRNTGRLEVSLIPETLQRTTFARRQVGDVVNLEVDPDSVVMVDTIATLLADRQWRESVGLSAA